MFWINARQRQPRLAGKGRWLCLWGFILLFPLAAAGGIGKLQLRAGAVYISALGSSYLALQDGEGSWQPLSTRYRDSLEKSVALQDPQGRFGVLHVCEDETTHNLSVQVHYGTLATMAAVVADCREKAVAAPPAPTQEVAIVAQGVKKGQYGNLYMGESSGLIDNQTQRYTLTKPLGEQDVVATLYAYEARVPSKLLYVPAESSTQATNFTVNFNGQNAQAARYAQVRLHGLRYGELLAGSVELLTPHGTVATLGEYVAGGDLPYAYLPQFRELGFRLRAEAQSFTYNRQTQAGLRRSVAQIFPSNDVPDLTLPPPLSVPEVKVTRRDPMRFTLVWSATSGEEGITTQFFSQVKDGRSVSYRLSQTPDWFPAGEKRRYTLPDFHALPEWQALWDMNGAEDTFWEVSYTLQTPLKQVGSSRSGVWQP